MRDRNARRDTLKTPASLLPDSQTLTLRLASALGPDADKQRSVRILSRTLPPFMSTFPNEIVTCQLPDGRKRRVFIKYQAGQSHACHGHRIDDPSLAFLRRYDAEYYRGWAQRTFEFSRPLHGRFPWLTILCGANEWFAPLLAQPQTVIHGEFYAKTILVRNENVFMVD